MTIRRAPFLVGLAVGMLAGICSVEAQSLDPGSKEALAAAVRALNDRPGQASAEHLDPRIRSLADSPEHRRELNELAAQILTEIAERTGGDAAKMSELLARGKSDPAAFAASLSPATRERLEALAATVAPAQK
jgi:hypothetical protein